MGILPVIEQWRNAVVPRRDGRPVCLIDDASGVGTQFQVADVNGDGLPDIAIANKKGIFYFEQVRN